MRSWFAPPRGGYSGGYRSGSKRVDELRLPPSGPPPGVTPPKNPASVRLVPCCCKCHAE